MKEDLIKALEDIRNNKSLLHLDEASIKASVIIRILSLLGWNTFDINEVRPEQAIESKRVDYSLIINKVNKVFIEVKRPKENLEAHQEQLLIYSFREGVKIAILTNGLFWWFYLPLNEGNWVQRRYFVIDVLSQKPEFIAEKLISLLSKDNISSSIALRDAQDIHNTNQKREILKEKMPAAWNILLHEPNESLITILARKTEEISGFLPDIKDVENFLNNLPRHQTTSSRQDPKKLLKFSPKPADEYNNKKIVSFTLFEKLHHPHNWKDLFIKVSEEIYQKHSNEFDRALTLRGTRRPYFSLATTDLKLPVQILDSKYFAESYFSKIKFIIIRCKKMLVLFEYEESDLSIEVK